MGRGREVADRIRAEIPIVDVLYDYGYRVHPDGEDREQQFSCDLHGDGADRTPSARVYPESASFHCFACGRSRDAITLVREKEGVEFWQAVKMLESKYGLPPLPWSAPEKDEKPQTEREVSQALRVQGQTSAQVITRIDRLIDTCCRERTVAPDQCAAWWEARDKISMVRRKGEVPEDVALSAALKVLASVRLFLGLST
jgi:DNA primase